MGVKSLAKKVLLFGIVFSLISITITTYTCYLVTNRFILQQFERVNEIATAAGVEKANTYLGEIADIASLSMKSEHFDRMIHSDESDPYVLIKAQKDYEAYLNNLILSNDKVDAVLVADQRKHIFVQASNTVGEDYGKYKSAEFYAGLKKPEVLGAGSPFLLDRYSDGNYERLAIISPVMASYSNEIEAYLIVVLSRKLIEEMQFAGSGIYITDLAGNSAEISSSAGGGDERTGQTSSFQNPLNYEGWTITNTFTFDKLQSSIRHNLAVNIAIGLFCLALSLIVLAIAGRRIVRPIHEMEAQIGAMNHSFLDRQPIVLSRRRIGFKLTLLILYSGIVTIPVVLITGSSYLSAKQTVESKVGSVFEYSAQILHQQMQFVFHNYRMLIIETSSVNDNVQKLLDAGGANEQASQADQADQEIRDEMNDLILSRNLFDKGISNITLYDASARLVYSSTYGRPFMMRPDTESDLAYLKDHFSSFLWRSYTDTPFNKQGIRVGMQIRGVADGIEAGKLLGYMLVDFNGEAIVKMLDAFLKYSYLDLYLVDRTGQNIISDLGRSEEKSLPAVLADHKISLDQQDRVVFREQGNNYLMIAKSFEENGWKLVFLLKNFNENEYFLTYSIAVLCGLLILSYGFSYGFSSMLLLNISALLRTARNVKRGNLLTRFKSNTVDEIYELGHSFNDMLDRIHLLIEEKYISELKAKEYELHLLQTQINPHFLYNTLKTAQYMAFAKDPRTEKMIKLLITLFKTSIARGEKAVSLREEIAHVKTYVEIQQMRFGGKVQAVYEASGEVLDLPVLKLTLQPIVENAIYHGLEVTERGGTIVITVRQESERLLAIAIRDDGAGMPEDKLKEIRARLEGQAGGDSIGIINVHERIKLFYGAEYGITVDSAPGAGTTVKIVYPLRIENG